jgi:RNA polymerase sigma-70 factor (ECF subfamily)
VAETLCVTGTLADGRDAPRSSPSVREADREAVEACQRGDAEAFGLLVARHQRDVYRLCYRYVGNQYDADDMAQEVFLKAFRSIGRLRGESAFSTWLYRIAVNTCLNFRSSGRRPHDEVSDRLPDPSPGVRERLEEEARDSRIRQAVERLPDKQRATLVLKVYQELSHEEVAAVLGVSVGTAKANLFHALRNLKRQLGREARG